MKIFPKSSHQWLDLSPTRWIMTAYLYVHMFSVLAGLVGEVLDSIEVKAAEKIAIDWKIRMLRPNLEGGPQEVILTSSVTL
jgi:hypothetical protein